MKRILNLITLEFDRNWKQPKEWLSVLLFLLATSMVLFMGFTRMRPETWAVLYWVVMLFAAVGATVGDFKTESYQERFLMHQLASPVEMFVAKVIYTAVFLALLELLLYAVFGMFFEFKAPFSATLLLVLLTGALSLSVVFTFVATLVNAAEKGSNLASLLGFPLVIPVILLLIKLFFAESGLSDTSENMQDVLSLLGIDALLLGLGILLYPLIWRS